MTESSGAAQSFTACPPHVSAAAAGTSGVLGVAPRAQPEDDGGEAAGPVQRGGGAQSPQVAVRAPQGSGREGEGAAAGGAGASVHAGGRAAVVQSGGESCSVWSSGPTRWFAPSHLTISLRFCRWFL